MADTVINGGNLLLYRKSKNTISTSSITAGNAGTGYAVGDTFYINNGAVRAIGKVATLAVTAVATYTLVTTGNECTVLAGNTTTTRTGAGSGLQITIATLANAGGIFQATGHSSTHKLSINHSTRDTSSKATGAYTSKESGRLDVSGSADGLAVYADGVGIIELSRMVSDREQIYLMFAQSTSGSETVPDTSTAGQFYAQGYFLLTSVEINAPDQDNVTYSISYELANNFSITNT